MSERREGEGALPIDPGKVPDATVAFIGRVGSAWKDRADCPKNMAAARQTGQPAMLQLDEAYRPGLDGLQRSSHAVVLTWLDRSVRDLIVQKPRHAAAPSGVFALRSPARPNPIGLHVCRIVAVDAANGVVQLDSIDVLDGTPLIDIKPYFASTDSIPDASRAERESSD
ncbi:tRNA (N6-threonylcarbamoyladenosine(37)-N6)-methyltransferase TrmO [Chelativorans sp. ZYF759]|uniref:tRNA (N6-threonylcarbamoyladenosine(37)-N6)-methyltransferase TrmO n=1 Tax=Chelativorans sp. ZYF759 TaxID=2692213 RepID=UPI00145CD5DC|nr:tRNA (N6-threonylcarbamoyladenosine(37)-N6)-methyltransferase TrmO [Chelativorans sp. ZYF759]NMG39564.1 tRNA (N6-threonylcarbamoyladenosine(37)-N6)-methyltransferase TrmO [Chelativorans sp. ZYF759]